MANSFSLLRLPNEERIQVLRCMDRRALLVFSLLSRNSKNLIRSLQLKPISSSSWDTPHFRVYIGRQVILAIKSWEVDVLFYKRPQENMTVLGKPNKVWISVQDGWKIVFQNPLEIKEWYEHILYIMNARPERRMILYQRCQQFDFPTIKTVFGKFDSLVFNFNEPRDVVIEVLRTFLPDLKELSLILNPYPHGDTRFQKMLIQNFDRFELGYCNIFQRLDVNDLLVCNAQYINFFLNQQIDNINQFLKLWIKGSNGRLRILTIEQRTDFIPEEILKGIRIIREIPREEEIVYEGDFDRRFAFRTRAVDIMRYDGTVGTVIINRESINFLVWN